MIVGSTLWSWLRLMGMTGKDNDVEGMTADVDGVGVSGCCCGGAPCTTHRAHMQANTQTDRNKQQHRSTTLCTQEVRFTF